LGIQKLLWKKVPWDSYSRHPHAAIGIPFLLGLQKLRTGWGQKSAQKIRRQISCGFSQKLASFQHRQTQVPAEQFDDPGTGAGRFGAVRRAAERNHRQGITAVEETPDGDYRFRTTATKKAVSEAIARQITDLDYTNFKNAVHGDPARDRAYMDVWAALHGLQSDKLRGTEPQTGFHAFLFPGLEEAE
jgi:hypothetical protein